MFPCPICGYELGEDRWKNDCPTYAICSCCGIEFGYEDHGTTKEERAVRHAELRREWIDRGMKWWSHSDVPPGNWDPRKQLERIGVLIAD